MERITKNIAVLEITSTAVKFAIGYSSNNVPHILHYSRTPLKGFVKDGKIPEPKALGEAIQTLNIIKDEDLNLKVNTKIVNVILPPIGFGVYEGQQSTTLVHDTVEAIDITNVRGMVERNVIPQGNKIVDIVPDYYVLDNGVKYINPPIGNRGKFLGINAKIYMLPDDVYGCYVQSVNYADFKVDHTGVATRCATEAVALDVNAPKTYFYVDMGARLTTISLVGNCSPFGSKVTPHGGDELTEKIAYELGLTFEEAEFIKTKFGYDQRVTKYNAPIFQKTNEDGTKILVTHEKLNKIILSFYEKYITYINAAFEALIKDMTNPQKGNNVDASKFTKLPIIISGGGSALYGIEKVLAPLSDNGSRMVSYYSPEVLGAREPGATNLIGLIIAECEYRGAVEDSVHRVSALTRN